MMTHQRVLPRVGERIQRYELLEELGRGGFGVVFRARQHGLDMDVAIKVVLPQDADDAETLQLYERFKQEADIAKQLLHPNAIKVSDYGRTNDGLPFIVSEYVRGQGLDALIGASGISFERTIKIATQVLGCLAEAHHRHIVHRDLKPANIMIQDMVGESDYVKVLDFGIAKLAEQAGGVQTQTGQAMGTPYYMSPEQCRGRKEIDGRSDLYSLGLVMAECLSGRRVVQTTDYMGAYYEHAKEQELSFEPIVEQSPLFPIIRTATAKNPDVRYPGAIEMRDALEYLRVTTSQRLPGAPAPTMPGPTLHAPPTPQSMAMGTAATAEQDDVESDSLARWRRVILTVLAIVMVGAFVVAVWPRPDSNDEQRTRPRDDNTALLTPEPSDNRQTPPTADDGESGTTTPDTPDTPDQQAAATARLQEGLVWAERELHRALPRTRAARITASEQASVLLGEEVVCDTPCELMLPAVDREVQLVIRRAGYRDHAETVNLATFRQLEVALEALPDDRRNRDRQERVDEPVEPDDEPREIRRLTVPTGPTGPSDIRRLTLPGSGDESSDGDD